MQGPRLRKAEGSPGPHTAWLGGTPESERSSLSRHRAVLTSLRTVRLKDGLKVGEVEGAGDVVVLAVTDGAGEVLALDDREADADGAAAEGVTLGLLVDPTVKSMLGNCTEARHGTVPSW